MYHGQTAIRHEVNVQLRAEAVVNGPAECRHGVFRHPLVSVVKPPVGIFDPVQLLPSGLLPPGLDQQAPGPQAAQAARSHLRDCFHMRFSSYHKFQDQCYRVKQDHNDYPAAFNVIPT